MKKFIYISGLIVLVALVAVFVFKPSEINMKNTFFGNGTIVSTETPVDQPKPNSQGLATYQDKVHGFSFSYPSGYNVGKLNDEGAETYLLQNEKGTGMQLVVTPFDEPLEKLTAARIQQDLPDLPMKDIAETTLPSAKITGVVFNSSGGGFGDSIELWFVHNGYLYQASTYLAQMSFLESVMGTFKF